jgi:hypothetical protein
MLEDEFSISSVSGHPLHPSDAKWNTVSAAHPSTIASGFSLATICQAGMNPFSSAGMSVVH